MQFDLETLNEKMVSQLQSGDMIGAIDTGESLVSTAETLVGKNLIDDYDSNPNLAQYHYNLSLAYHAARNFEDAKKHCLQSLSIRQNYFGKESVEAAQTLNLLGVIELISGDRSHAKEHLTASVIIMDQISEEEDIEKAEFRSNLGKAYNALGDSERALEQLSIAVEIKQDHFGLYHPSVAFSLIEVAVAFENLGQLDEAKSACSSALDIMSQTMPPQHPEYIKAENLYCRLVE